LHIIEITAQKARTLEMVVLALGLISTVMITPSPITVNSSESSPYDSGYNHGHNDSGLPESDKYINQPEKGPSFHTQEFMNGYYDGLNNCGSREAAPPLDTSYSSPNPAPSEPQQTEPT
jgi:hypothetical protein